LDRPQIYQTHRRYSMEKIMSDLRQPTSRFQSDPSRGRNRCEEPRMFDVPL